MGCGYCAYDSKIYNIHTQFGYSGYRICNWLSLRRLVSWINDLPPAYWSTFWKSIFKLQLGCRFDILDSISSFFCILTYAIIHVWIHHIIFLIYLYFLNILYFFKYSCTNNFHRRSPCTLYGDRSRLWWTFRIVCTRDLVRYIWISE